MYENAARLTLRDNGGTFTLDGKAVIHERGYLVGGIVPSTVIPVVGTATLADALAGFVRLHSDKLAYREYCYLGTWIHEGRIHIDVSEWFGDRNHALYLARERGELAIWDCQHGNEISLEVE